MTTKDEINSIRNELLRAQGSINAALAKLESIAIDEPGPFLALTAPKPEMVSVRPLEEVKKAIEEPLITTDEWKRTLDALHNGREHIFITGGAGTGKSTLLQEFMSTCNRTIAAVCPTGVAALRIKAQTIHSFFHFGAHVLQKDDIRELSPSRQAKFKALDDLIIDEASMVRADLMDAIDQFLRLNGREKGKPFGGVRLILVGDLFQLPPFSREKEEKKYLKDRYGLDAPYFFHAEAWRDCPPKIHELTTIFRQSDAAFTGALNAIRNGTATTEHLDLLNKRVDRSFKPPVDGDLWLILTTTNNNADQANDAMLSELKSPSKVFMAVVQDDFDLKNAPTDIELRLKVGAVVMFIRNDADKRWHNGTLGKVVSVNPLKVDIKERGIVDVLPETWEDITYDWDEKAKKLSRSVKGKFTQIPLKLAAAVTIHKAQGTTLDRAILDLHHGTFADGQLYVGASRLRSLEGLILRKPIKMSDISVNEEVRKFMKGLPIARPLLAAGQLL